MRMHFGLVLRCMLVTWTEALAPAPQCLGMV